MTYPAPGQPTGPDRRPRVALWLAAGFVAFVVICLVVVLVSTSGTDQQPDTPAAPPPPAAQDAGEADQTIPTAAPPGVSWTYFRGVALPHSRTYGPTRTEGDVAAGYEHSPTGALLAAANISVRYRRGIDWQEVLEQQTAPGPGRKAWTAVRGQHPINPNEPAAAPGNYGQFSGFRFVNYSSELATIQVATQFANYGGAQQMSTLTVQWNGQDWVLVLQPDGSPSPQSTVITSADQFVIWGPT